MFIRSLIVRLKNKASIKICAFGVWWGGVMDGAALFMFLEVERLIWNFLKEVLSFVLKFELFSVFQIGINFQ